jgi:hypothetical protein
MGDKNAGTGREEEIVEVGGFGSAYVLKKKLDSFHFSL